AKLRGPRSSCPRTRRRGPPRSSARCWTIRRGCTSCLRRCSASRVQTLRTRSPRSCLPSPLEGRRLWIAGIGGAGMSAYALLAREAGARVRGWARVRPPYLAHLAGIDVTIADDPPEPPPGWEVFVSTAFADRVAGRTRAELLAELVSLRDAVVVAGAHGKTTTAGMIAFCLERLGWQPAWVIGGGIPQLRGDARTRGGGGSARRGGAARPHPRV